jgi:hypothetical protein
MDAVITKAAESQPVPGSATAQKRTKKSRQSTEEVLRYFLAKEGSSSEKPELGAEIATEGEALIKAFQSKSGTIYVLLAYKAEAEIQGGSPTLVKRALRKESAQAGRK